MNSLSGTFEETGLNRIHMEKTLSDGFNASHMHTHVEYEMLFVIDGTLSVDNNVHSMTVTAPCILIHKPFMLHRANTVGNCRYERYVVNFSTDFVNRLSPWIPNFSRLLSSSMTVIELGDELKLCMQAMFDNLWHSFTAKEHIRAELELALILNKLCADVEDNKIHSMVDELSYISKVMDYICHHFGETIITEELANIFFVSRAKLTADFKNSTSVTVKQYIQLTRINNAKLLLLAGHSISEVAQLCGFCDDSHFIHTFRNIVGMTPRAFLSGKGFPNA